MSKVLLVLMLAADVVFALAVWAGDAAAATLALGCAFALLGWRRTRRELAAVYHLAQLGQQRIGVTLEPRASRRRAWRDSWQEHRS